MEAQVRMYSRSRVSALSAIMALVIFPIFLGLISISARAQSYFEGRVVNPFGMAFTPSESDLVFHALVDIDRDGDLDDFVSHRVFLSPCWEVLSFEYYENQGSSDCPEYVLIPGERFGLPALAAAITFVDIDDDGDQDAFIGNHCINSVITFHENKGSATVPVFESTPSSTLNTSSWGIAFAMLNFGDLDGDGDFDALVNGLRPAVFKFLKNTGTPTVFNFSAPVDNPFGLSIPSFNSSEWSHFTDWDCDGDLDILNGHWQGGTNHNNWKLYIHENTGTATAPAFIQPVATELLLMPIAMGDMDGDGDADIFSDEYYYKKIAATDCVTLPTAAFSTLQTGLAVEFVNESAGQSTSCRPLEYHWDFGDGTTSDEAAPTHTFALDGTYTVCLSMEDVAGTATFCDDITVVASGLNQIQPGDAVILYPNPASGYLTVKIEGKSQLKEITIDLIDPLGMVVHSSVYDTPDFDSGVRVDVSGLASGIYVIRITDEEKSWSGKIWKDR